MTSPREFTSERAALEAVVANALCGFYDEADPEVDDFGGWHAGAVNAVSALLESGLVVWRSELDAVRTAYLQSALLSMTHPKGNADE